MKHRVLMQIGLALTVLLGPAGSTEAAPCFDGCRYGVACGRHDCLLSGVK